MHAKRGLSAGQCHVGTVLGSHFCKYNSFGIIYCQISIPLASLCLIFMYSSFELLSLLCMCLCVQRVKSFYENMFQGIVFAVYSILSEIGCLLYDTSVIAHDKPRLAQVDAHWTIYCSVWLPTHVIVCYLL